MRVERFYVVSVTNSSGKTRVSQEGYKTLEAAQEFCRNRADHPQEISPHEFKSIVYKYEISYVYVPIRSECNGL